jgi:hypothetical protein
MTEATKAPVELPAACPSASSRRVAGITHPPVVPSNGRALQVGRRGPRPSVTGEGCPRCRTHHPLRGRPALHPDGCSSSCLSSRSMPSRMNDEVVLYFVYGTSSLIQSHVAWSRRKVTTRGFRVTRSPRLRVAVIDLYRDRRLNPIRPSTVLFMDGHEDRAN